MTIYANTIALECSQHQYVFNCTTYTYVSNTSQKNNQSFKSNNEKSSINLAAHKINHKTYLFMFFYVSKNISRHKMFS